MRWTIRTKLVAILLLLTLTSVCLVGYRAYQVARTALEDRIGQSLRKQAVNVINQLDNLFLERYRNMENWISLDIMTDILTQDANGSIRNFLATMKNEYGLYADLVYVDTKGNVIAGSRPRLIGKNVIEETWFQQAFAQPGIQAHDLTFSRLVGKSVITFAAPIRTDLLLRAPQTGVEGQAAATSVIMAEFGETSSRTIGVLAAFLDWSEIISLINTTPIMEEEEQHQGAYAMLIDAQGLALTQPYFDETAIIHHENLVELEIEAARLAAMGQSGYTIEKGRYGNEALIGYASARGYRNFRGFDWSILVFQDTHEALAPIRGLQFQIFGIAVLVGLIVAVIAFLFAQGITRPIVQLAIGAYHIAKGDFSQRVNVQSKDELGALAASFNQMTEDLDKTTHQLMAAKDYADNIIRSTLDALIVMDSSGKIRQCNPAVKNLFGYEGSELAGKSIAVLLAAKDLEQTTHLESIEKGLLSTAEVAFKKKDGSIANMLASATIMKNKEGQSQGIVLVAKDITEYKELEQQFLHSQKLDAVGRLAGGVAHDFNNMLTIIKIYSERVLRKLEDREQLYKEFEQVLKAADRGARLVRQLLAFSRQDVVKPVPIDVNELIKDMTKMMALLTGENVTLDIKTTKNIWTFRADSGQIEQVLANLVNNARDAMEGKGAIAIKTENVTVQAEDRSAGGIKPGDYVLLSVKDTGSGMTEEVKKRIFDPFFTTKEKGKGTGLGLATCYGIITQAGGFIDLDTAPGKGTMFKIYFPRVMGEKAVRAPVAENKDLPRGTETILFAEDEEPVRRIAADSLKEQGYTVYEAVDGQDALEKYGKINGKKIDLLLSDVIMPRVDGKELAAKISKLQPGVKILFASAYGPAELENLDLGTSYSDFLQKPYSEAELISRVRKIMDHQNSTQK